MIDIWPMPSQNGSTMLKAVVKKTYKTPYPQKVIWERGLPVRTTDRESEWPGWVWCERADGQAGWVPASYLARGDSQTMLAREYDSTELTAIEGEELAVEFLESGWAWCKRPSREAGWVPLEYLDLL